MARRITHTTDLGCITCGDLSDLGAGKEGWLVGNPNLLTALDTHSIALADRSIIIVIQWLGGGGAPDAKITPELSPIQSEYISALEWLISDDIKVIAVGTSCGYLLIYSLRGDLIHKQLVNTGKVLKLRVRVTKKNQMHDASLEEVCVVMPGTVARFEGSDIQRMLQKWFRERYSQSWDPNSREVEDSGNSFARLPYQLWNINKYGSCFDAAITGVIPPPLMELQLLLLLDSQVSIIIVQSLWETTL
ncbi:unnamed protein product [Cuscuta epithymum]|uniref:Rab3-GAP regulatory subunit N-terminal domain-containing protein n=1 Tax=Cuscuta epithymum TaxID=186058 RepID=A0AAV0FJX3_9ASTE|nr:unnamed protein product [Cuscuta epithymum]